MDETPPRRLPADGHRSLLLRIKLVPSVPSNPTLASLHLLPSAATPLSLVACSLPRLCSRARVCPSPSAVRRPRLPARLQTQQPRAPAVSLSAFVAKIVSPPSLLTGERSTTPPAPAPSSSTPTAPRTRCIPTAARARRSSPSWCTTRTRCTASASVPDACVHAMLLSVAEPALTDVVVLDLPALRLAARCCSIVDRVLVSVAKTSTFPASTSPSPPSSASTSSQHAGATLLRQPRRCPARPGRLCPTSPACSSPCRAVLLRTKPRPLMVQNSVQS